MAKLDYAIYGMDDNDFAEGIAADALKPGGSADLWGATFDQDAGAKGNDSVHEQDFITAKAKTSEGTQKAQKSEGN